MKHSHQQQTSTTSLSKTVWLSRYLSGSLVISVALWVPLLTDSLAFCMWYRVAA